MKKLAIQGDKNNDVISLLVILGEKNENLLSGKNFNCVYFIHHGIIDYIDKQKLLSDYVVYTFEEFNKKHLFKIGDMVNIPEYEYKVRINAMKWGINSESVLYMVYRVDEEEWYTTEELLDYNDVEDYKNLSEKTSKCITYGSDSDICKLDIQKENTDIEYPLPDGFQFVNDKGEVINTTKIILKRIKPKYPKTYEECCDVLKISKDEQYIIDIDIPLNYNKLLSTFAKLLICRDVYWQIAGEELGLGKPWELCHTKKRYVIRRAEDKIVKSFNVSCVLEFPTHEIRDTFYENFKDLIEKCKKLL